MFHQKGQFKILEQTAFRQHDRGRIQSLSLGGEAEPMSSAPPLPSPPHHPPFLPSLPFPPLSLPVPLLPSLSFPSLLPFPFPSPPLPFPPLP